MPCRTLFLRSVDDGEELQALLAGRDNPGDTVEPAVREILDTVRAGGDAALADYTRRFDCPGFDAARIRVGEDEIAAALEEVGPGDRAIIAEAAANIRAFHEAQKERSWFSTRPDGSVLGQMVTPVDRAGLYVPGGQGGNTPLISSLLMNAIPAQVAGVPEIAVISPPRKDGTLNPFILAAAHHLGVTEVHRAGSAWAIAALAFGTETVRPVDVIAGPGNIWVTTAKRLLIGRVGIDMIAGPSDMLSQAEHDPLASSICVTDSPALVDALKLELAAQCDTLPRADIARKALVDWGAIVVVPDMDTGVAITNRIAPEHLEVLTRDPWALLGSIRHAGAVFLGGWSPEPVGDYFAGPNHVLPTMGTARFSSALSVQTFCKRTSVISATAAFTRSNAASIARLARLEGLEAHARSAESRNR